MHHFTNFRTLRENNVTSLSYNLYLLSSWLFLNKSFFLYTFHLRAIISYISINFFFLINLALSQIPHALEQWLACTSSNYGNLTYACIETGHCHNLFPGWQLDQLYMHKFFFCCRWKINGIVYITPNPFFSFNSPINISKQLQKPEQNQKEPARDIGLSLHALLPWQLHKTNTLFFKSIIIGDLRGTGC